jgi:valine dehydrogenase (NAD+)
MRASGPETIAPSEPLGDTQQKHGSSFERARAKVDGIFDVGLRVFRAADEEGVSPAVSADRLAEERIRSVGRLATIRLPR